MEKDCVAWLARLSVVEQLSADHLMAAGHLKLVAVQNLRGLTCDLLFFVVPRRNPLDDTWEGDILREVVLYSVMMRATQRLVILTEYMVTMPLPPKGRLRHTALQLGVKVT